MTTQFENFTVTEVNWQIITGDEIPNTVLTLTPDAGYFLDANNFSATINSPVSNIYFTQSGNNVLMTVEFDSTPVVEDLSIPICMNGYSGLIVFTLQVNYDYSLLNASASLPPAVITKQGLYNTTSSVFTNATFEADDGFYFLNTPTCVVSIGDISNYALTNSKTFDSNNNLISISFTAQYTFPAINVYGDEILVNASAVALPAGAPVQVRSYSFLNSEFSSDGETRRFIAFGTQGANWTLTINNGATPSTYSSVIPSGGQDFLDVIIPPNFAVDYTFTLTGDLISPFPQQNPFTISQAGAIPVLQTSEVTNITEFTAVSGGYNILDYSSPITQKGVEWSTTNTFDTILGSTNEGTGSGDFVSNITGLENNIIYYVRAYAINSVGTGYGEAMEFLTIETIPCGATQTPGGSGIEDISIALSPSGGLVAFLVYGAATYPDKFEIFHGADTPVGTTVIANKKATSGYDLILNSGAFDNLYGTSDSDPAPPLTASPTGIPNPNGGVIPNLAQAQALPQFISAAEFPPTRQTEFTDATGFIVGNMTVGGTDYQQIVWWSYGAADYDIQNTATLRVTAPHDVSTVWEVLRLCCPDANCATPAPLT